MKRCSVMPPDGDHTTTRWWCTCGDLVHEEPSFTVVAPTDPNAYLEERSDRVLAAYQTHVNGEADSE